MAEKKFKWDVGSWKGQSDVRKRPSVEEVSKFINEMGPSMSDYDVYLWGSWPERKETWDVDLLLNNNSPVDTEEMENIVTDGLENGLIKYNFMPDMGFSKGKKEMRTFKNIMDDYKTNGRLHTGNGYVYGKNWTVNGKSFRDRNKWTGGTLEELDNNMFAVKTTRPYSKMLDRMNNFDKYYGDKPLLISNRKKIYGNLS